jgi:acetate kinase
MNVLVLNSGSSSQKSCLYQLGNSLPGLLPYDSPTCVWEGKIEWTDSKAQYSIKNSSGLSQKERIPFRSREHAIERLLNSLWSGKTQAISSPSEIDVVGHRVVHGGPRYFEPSIINAKVKAAIKSVSVFAPLHNRAELEGMEIVASLLGHVPQIAVFDTGFHRTMPLSSATYPGPYGWFKQGIRHISGISGDMREILTARKNGHARSQLAFEMYVHRLHSGIGAMIAVLGGVDALIFTAGVGENSPELRAAVCDHFAFLGLKLDPRKNSESPSDEDISASDSTVRAMVIHAQEDWMIARECWNLMKH